MRIGRVLVTVALVAVTAASSGCSRAAAPADGAPVRVHVRGRDIPFAGPQAWTLASVPSRSARTVTVFATGSDAVGGGACGPPVVRLRAEESATTVRVLVADYQEPASTVTACPAIGYLPSAHPIRLRTPLGRRTLLDASTGKAPDLLVGTEWPDLARPPGSPAAGALTRWDRNGPVERTWAYRDGSSLSLQIEAPASTREIAPYGRIVRQLTLRRTPATVYAAGGRKYGTVQVVWTPNDRQTLLLQGSNSPARRWSADKMVALARAVTGYSVTATGRLPQPVTPGTAAAGYSSADGPVHHAENLLKSSGVYIGVNCEGEGALTVTVRGTPFTFRCTAALTHHVRESVGDPNASFLLDVTADPGVRWAVTLARASLDGS